MKKCPLCGNEYQDGTTCPSCGILLIDLDTNQAVGTGAGRKESKREEKKFGRKADKKAEQKSTGSQAAPTEPVMDWDYGLPMPEVAVEPEEFNWEDVEVTAPEDEMELESFEDEENDSFEEQETEEMPVPPVAPTQDMDWDYGLPKPEQLGGGAGGSGGNGTGTSNQRAKKEKEPGKGFTFTVTPPMIAIGIAIILLLVAGGFIISHFKAKKEAEQYYSNNSYEEYDDEYTEDYSDLEEPEEPDLSNVDINAVEDSYMVAQGTLVKRGADYMLEMDESQNIYIYDRDSGENKVVEDVDRLIVDVNYLSADVSEAYGREVILYGYLQMYDSDIVLEAEQLEKIRTEADELAIHNYEIKFEDCSWSDAMSYARDRGGYLVRINSKEEFNHIAQLLNGYGSYHFYLGGARDLNSKEYYWVDESYNYMGEPINSSSSWSNGSWFRNEPSFVDNGYDAGSPITEDVMNLFCIDGTWYLNDTPSDLIGNYSGILSGKVGYIIEYE